MKKMAVIFFILCMVLAGRYAIPPTDGNAVEAPLMQKELYVDDDPGSTYDNIRDALIFAIPGDTIVVAPGTYYENIDVDRPDITIIGNISDGEIKVVGGPSPAIIVHDCFKVYISGINFTSTGNSGIRIERANNITFEACTAWSTGGTSGAMNVYDSQHVMVFSKYAWPTSIPSVFHAEGVNNVGIYLEVVQTFRFVDSSILTLDVQGHCIHAVDRLVNTSIEASDFEARGPNSNIFDLGGYTEMTIWGPDHPPYTKNFIEIESGTVDMYTTRFNENDVHVTASANIYVWTIKRVFVRDENNITGIEDCDIRVTVDGSFVYRTEHFGGSDPASDTLGEFPDDFELLNRKYIGSSTPITVVNMLDFYYDGGDVSVEGSLEIEASLDAPFFLMLPDFTLPQAPRNLRADTIDHRTLELIFEQSTSEDVTHYEVWFKSVEEWEWQFNTSSAGSFPFLNLEPATEYGFRVFAVDDAGLRNYSEVYGTTGPPIEGSLKGNVTYSGGPLNGTSAVNSEVKLYNNSGGLVGIRTVIMDELFEFDSLLFAENYTAVITPMDAVEQFGNASGYVADTFIFDFTKPTIMVFLIGYYEYVPPVTTGLIEGRVTYLNGPMTGMNSSNATVFLYDMDGEKLGNMTTGADGLYMFEGVPFADNYTLKVVPEDAVVSGGEVSGYIEKVITFDFNASMFLPLSIEYYTYTPPSGGPIYGRVLYSDGPEDGDPVVMAKVEVLSNGGSFAYVNTNSTGHYRLSSIGFGTNYTIRVTPPMEHLGIVDNNSGYLVKVSEPFDHEAVAGEEVDVELEYYEYIPGEPPVENPKVTILDENGDPVPGVLVTVTINGTIYTAITDANGTAEFTQLTGSEFPQGTHFKASKDGYEDIEWDQGENIPPMVKEKEDEDEPNLLTVILVLIIVLLALGIVILFLRRRTGYEEE